MNYSGSKKFLSTLLQGVAVVVPVGVTIYVCVYAMWWLDETVRSLLERVVHVEVPVVGFVVGLGTIYVIGLLTRSLLLRKVGRLGEALVERIPLVKSLYGALKDMMMFVGGGDPTSRGVPARLHLMDGKVHMLGIVTQKKPEEQFGREEKGRVAVYLPMSLQIGGFTVFIPEEKVEYMEDMSVETAMRLAMTAGMGHKRRPLRGSKKKKKEDGEQPAPEAG